MVEGLKLLGQSGSTAQRRVRDVFETAQETLQSRVGGAREQAQETWDNLEALFQSRVQRAMHQLGVPTAEEIRALTRRVSELNDSVSRIDQRVGEACEAAGAQGGRSAAARQGKAQQDRGLIPPASQPTHKRTEVQPCSTCNRREDEEGEVTDASGSRSRAAGRSARSTKSAACTRSRKRSTASS